MSNVVQFLEALSLDPHGLGDKEYALAVSAACFDSPTQEALIKRDPLALNAVLGGRGTVMAFIMPAENDEEERKDGEPQPDDGDSEAPDRDQEPKSRAA